MEKWQRWEKISFASGVDPEFTEEIVSIPGGALVARAKDTLIGTIRRIPVGMVVLSVGLTPARDADTVRRLFKIKSGGDGWFLERHPKLAPVSTATEGIFLAGACQEPKDIPESVAQAGAAAAEAVSLPGDCHYQEGNYKTLRRFVMLKKLLAGLGVEDERVRLEWIAASEGDKVQRICNEMTAALKRLGPNTVRQPMSAVKEQPVPILAAS